MAVTTLLLLTKGSKVPKATFFYNAIGIWKVKEIVLDFQTYGFHNEISFLSCFILSLIKKKRGEYKYEKNNWNIAFENFLPLCMLQKRHVYVPKG